MLELKAKDEEKGKDELDKRLVVVKERKVGRFIVEIDGDGAVVASLAGRVSPKVIRRSNGQRSG